MGVRFHREAIRKRSLRSLLGEIITNKKAEKHGFKKWSLKRESLLRPKVASGKWTAATAHKNSLVLCRSQRTEPHKSEREGGWTGTETRLGTTLLWRGPSPQLWTTAWHFHASGDPAHCGDLVRQWVPRAMSSHLWAYLPATWAGRPPWTWRALMIRRHPTWPGVVFVKC